ncbi:28S ribosomal protein S30, mitochondrial [Armadillidium nasatum]|uniref:28S ribosomal protein S30, mitochondrial n=1 Tax=Armadillidium nasatum TaxID=96803 RepID=A0A5N5T7M4_9CRUS|nr:28S ribosomal protein S30, mitochondrial [Armadillidium nasatum]
MENRLRKLGKEFCDQYRPCYLQQQAINDAFAQALSYSFYQGFTPGDELTYPFVQQGVSSDGRNFQFSLYQLNTFYLHDRHSTDNPRLNYLWLSEDMPLYETVEEDDVKGLNKDVLKLLCTMYLKKGIERQNPSPYLAHYKYLMHHNAPDEYKEEFQNILRNNILSERKFRRVEKDPLPWEFIYKMKYKTRLIDPKLKYFEKTTVTDPHKRRLDDYEPNYIPKIRRIDVRIKKKPIIDSELLFKHKESTINKRGQTYEDDPIVFGSMNVDKETPPYNKDCKLWRRGVNKFQKSLLAKKKK